VCLFNRVDRPNVRGALGTPLPGVDVAVREGEIRVRGESVFRGYVSHGSDGLAVTDGWLRTGDRGSLADGGSIVFDGVIKPMFTRNGFNIYPREIELTVEALDGVESARVHAVRSDHDEAELEIALDVRGTTTEAAVRAWCAERLSRYKQPSIVRVL
jgi:long-chain acyl-CoA synthetase